jgi:hypothetical protein
MPSPVDVTLQEQSVICLSHMQECRLCTVYMRIRMETQLWIVTKTDIGFTTHCNGNPIYIFLFRGLSALSPNFHIHVSVSDLYIPRIGPRCFLQQNRQIDGGNI